MRQLSCRSKDSLCFYGDGVGWVRRGVRLALGSGVGLQAMFEAGRRKSHGWRLFVMANVIEIFCAAFMPLIMMWSLDFLASLFTNGQKFK